MPVEIAPMKKEEFPTHLVEAAIGCGRIALAENAMRVSLANLSGLDAGNVTLWLLSEKLVSEATKELNLGSIPTRKEFCKKVENWINTMPEAQLTNMARRISDFREGAPLQKIREDAYSVAILLLQEIAEQSLAGKAAE